MKSALSLAMFALATSRVKGSAAELDTFCNNLAGTDECVWSSAPDANGVYKIDVGYTRFELAAPVTLQDSKLYVADPYNGYIPYNGFESAYIYYNLSYMSDNIIRGDETGITNFYYLTDPYSYSENGWRTVTPSTEDYLQMSKDQSSEEIQHFVVKHISSGSSFYLYWSPPEGVTVLSPSCEQLEQEWLAAGCACTPDSEDCGDKKDAWSAAGCEPQTCG